jgi:hypothetical protein
MEAIRQVCSVIFAFITIDAYLIFAASLATDYWNQQLFLVLCVYVIVLFV